MREIKIKEEVVIVRRKIRSEKVQMLKHNNCRKMIYLHRLKMNTFWTMTTLNFQKKIGNWSKNKFRPKQPREMNRFRIRTSFPTRTCVSRSETSTSSMSNRGTESNCSNWTRNYRVRSIKWIHAVKCRISKQFMPGSLRIKINNQILYRSQRIRIPVQRKKRISTTDLVKSAYK